MFPSNILSLNSAEMNRKRKSEGTREIGSSGNLKALMKQRMEKLKAVWWFYVWFNFVWSIKYTLNSGAGTGGARGVTGPPPQYLADQLTLFQPWGADSAHPLLVAPPMFFTFRHHCNVVVLSRIDSFISISPMILHSYLLTYFFTTFLRSSSTQWFWHRFWRRIRKPHSY